MVVEILLVILIAIVSVFMYLALRFAKRVDALFYDLKQNIEYVSIRMADNKAVNNVPLDTPLNEGVELNEGILAFEAVKKYRDYVRKEHMKNG